MCLAAWSIAQSARFPCVIATNRDEYFDRPAAPLAWWSTLPDRSPQASGPDPARILAGRDLAAGGTWLGLSPAGGFALLTNVREPGRFDPQLPTRGDLVQQALAIDMADNAALAALSDVPRNGFNLLRLDLHGSSGIWVGNHPKQSRRFGAGVHGLSNAALNTPWRKVRRLTAALTRAVTSAANQQALTERCFAALTDWTPAADADLPDTGIGLERERLLSPAFVRLPAGATGIRSAYGTRCSTLVIVQAAGPHATHHALVIERRYTEAGTVAGETRISVGLP